MYRPELKPRQPLPRNLNGSARSRDWGPRAVTGEGADANNRLLGGTVYRGDCKLHTECFEGAGGEGRARGRRGASTGLDRGCGTRTQVAMECEIKSRN
eukprot:601094-Rhodomonas_salina.3